MRKYLLLTAAALLATGVQAQFSIQKVVLEEFTGAWCQYCPDGAVIAEQVNNNYENAIVYAIHDNDAMEVPEGADLVSFYAGGFPEGQINRSGAQASRNQWSSMVGTALQGASVATVSIDSLTYDVLSRQLDLDVKVMFTGPTSGDMRINLAIFEDHVTGTGSGYNQVNYYNGVAGHTFYQAGNPIVGFDHRHVLRTLLSGAWGESGIITTPVNFGATFTKHYTYTLPAGWDATEIGLAAMVQRYDGANLPDREIINAEEFYLSSLLVSNEPTLNNGTPVMSIAPNPSAGRTRVNFSLETAGQIRMEVLNALGQHVATLGEGIMNEGLHTLHWNGTDAQGNEVGNGIYMVRLLTENGQSATQRVMIAR